MADRKASPISDGIRAAIRASGRSVYSIAKQVECSPQQLYNFLAGKRCLSQATLDRLGEALDLEVKGQSAAPPGEAGTSTADVIDLEPLRPLPPGHDRPHPGSHPLAGPAGDAENPQGTPTPRPPADNRSKGPRLDLGRPPLSPVVRPGGPPSNSMP